jgi:hypothetical protein
VDVDCTTYAALSAAAGATLIPGPPLISLRPLSTLLGIDTTQALGKEVLVNPALSVATIVILFVSGSQSNSQHLKGNLLRRQQQQQHIQLVTAVCLPILARCVVPCRLW